MGHAVVPRRIGVSAFGREQKASFIMKKDQKLRHTSIISPDSKCGEFEKWVSVNGFTPQPNTPRHPPSLLSLVGLFGWRCPSVLIGFICAQNYLTLPRLPGWRIFYN